MGTHYCSEAFELITTTDDQVTSQRISDQLVQSRRTPCVKIYPGCLSRYFWNGSWHEATEYVIVTLALAPDLEQLTAIIKSVHNYTNPEIVARQLKILSSDYADWIQATIVELGVDEHHD